MTVPKGLDPFIAHPMVMQALSEKTTALLDQS